MAGPRPPDRMIPALTLHGGRTERYAGDYRFRPAAYGIAVREGRVLLGRSAFSGLWDIPGGAVEPWELLPEGLKREFFEETGVECEVEDAVHFAESFFAIFTNSYHSLRFYFRVRVPEDAILLPQRAEISDLNWVNPEQAVPEDFAPGDLAILRRVLGN